MKFFITTSSTISLYDGQLSDIKVFPNGIRVFGLSWDYDYGYVSVTYSDRESDVIYRFDKNFNFEEISISEKLKDVHQLLVVDKDLYIINTFYNKILKLNLDNFKLERKKWRGKEPPVHLNSIWYNNNKFYVVEHRMNNSKILITNNELEQLKEISGLRHVHNVYIENNKLFCSSSIETSLVIIDPMSGKILEKKRLKELHDNVKYLRGFARSENNWLIGFSKYDKREKRPRSAHGSVVILDNNFKTINHLSIPGKGQIHEIRIINEIDKAHNNIIWEN